MRRANRSPLITRSGSTGRHRAIKKGKEMKRIAICLALLISLIIPTTSPANASEKCLANFADSEWVNGTPSGVKSLIGFDLVEKITKTPESTLNFLIQSFYLFGEHTETTKYNYVGKNCLAREVIVSKIVNEQSLKFGYQTIDEFINKRAPNFVTQENSAKYYSSIKAYFANKTFDLKTKQILPQEENLGSTRGIQRFLISENSKFQTELWPGSAFIYFPSKCAYWNAYDENGNETREKIYAGGVGRYPAGGIIKFESTGNCVAELRQAGGVFSVAEKIADVKYVVSGAAPVNTITCKKGKTTKKVKGTSPKCPTGYKKA
jgi:hypothetical protein